MAVRELVVKVSGDASGLRSALRDGEGGIQRFGRAAKVIGVAVGGGVVAAGVALAKLGDEFDNAYDSIAVATGATGDVLAGLNDSFDNVLSSGPYAFEETATAIGDLNTRLGVTGEPLEALSGQFLDLARITGEDVAGNIEAWSQAFSKFGVPAEEMGTHLDAMFRTSQASGLSMQELGSQLTRFGAPLQGLGFSMEESTALLANFELAGVNTQSAMGGMTRALGELAREGEDAPTALNRIVGEIASMEDASAATGLAVELFGTRAGPELAAAIRSGQFDLEAMLDVIENGEGSISGTAAATDNWREKLQHLRNKILVKLKPLAEAVFNGITTAATWLFDWVERHWPTIEAALMGLWEWMKRNVVPIVKSAVRGVTRALGAIVNFIEDNWEGVRDALVGAFEWLLDNKEVLLGVAVAIGVGLVAMFTSWAISAGAAAIATLAAIAPFVAIGAAIAGSVAGVVYAYNHFETFRNIVNGVARFFRDVLWPILQGVFDGIKSAAQAVVEWFQDNWDTISTVVETVFNVIKGVITNVVIPIFTAIINAAVGVVNWFRDNWDRIAGIVGTIIDGGGAVIDWFTNLPSTLSTAFGDGFAWLRDKARDVRNYISERVTNIVDAVKGISTRAANLFGDGFGWLRTKALEVRNYISERVTNIVDSIKGIATRAANLFGDGFGWLRDKARDVRNYISDRVTNIVDAIKGIPGRAKNLFGNGFQWLKDQATSARDWIKTKVDDVVGFFTGMPSRISTGISMAATALGTALGEIGGRIANGIRDGFKSAWNAVANRLNNLIPNSIPITPGSVFGVSLPQVNIPLPDNPIPTLHTGGWATGVPLGNRELLAILEEGEFVLSRSMVRDLASGTAHPPGPVLSIDQIVVGDPRDVLPFRDELERAAFALKVANS